MSNILDFVERLNKDERKSLIEKLSELDDSPEAIKSEAIASFQKLQNDFASLDPENWDNFRQGFCDFCGGLERRLWPLIHDYHDCKEAERVAEIREMLQAHVDRGLKFEKLIMAGNDFTLKDGKVQWVDDTDIPF